MDQDQDFNTELSQRLEVRVAVLAERLRQTDHRIIELNSKLDEFREYVDKMMTKQAEEFKKLRESGSDHLVALENRWKGGILTLITIGGIIGWIVTYWERFLKWLFGTA